MSTPVIITSLISLIPAVILTICIFWLDRLEREPLTLLLRLLLTGAVFYFGAYYLRVQIVRAIDRVMAGQMEFNLTGVVSFDAPAARFLNQALNSWGAVALIDVLAIWLVLRFFVVNLPDYDCFFDGIVYGAVTALGFAVSSCMFYALRFGMDTLVLRALVTGPSIIMTGVFTGLFFSLGKEREAGDGGSGAVFYLAALLVPAFLYGLLSFIRMVEDPGWKIPETGYMLVLTAASISVIWHYSKNDHYFPDIRQFH